MRELHDGIELLEDERRAGPFVWRNWDKWVARCEEVVKWIDRKVLSDGNEKKPPRPNHWKKLGLVCGVEWPVFRTTVDRYREWLDKQYGGPSKLREQLVFAHNDASFAFSSARDYPTDLYRRNTAISSDFSQVANRL